VLAKVEGLEEDRGSFQLLWGSVFGRPILFSVEEQAGREMLDALSAGEEPVAIVEPTNLIAETLD
jgi:hypothetical protein